MSTQLAKDSRKKYRGDRGYTKHLRSHLGTQIRANLNTFVGHPLNVAEAKQRVALFFKEHPELTGTLFN